MDSTGEPVPEAETGAPIEAAVPVPLLGERLSPRVIGHWYATDLVRAGVISAMAIGAAEIWLRDASTGAPAWLPDLAYAFAGLVVLLTLLWPPLSFRAWRFSVDDDYLAMRYGVLFVEERRVPVPRMQHVDLMRGPIERLFGLATLVVFTAGNEGSAFRVPGLLVARAEALRDGVLRARGRDGV